jgi:hypothetical protein
VAAIKKNIDGAIRSFSYLGYNLDDDGNYNIDFPYNGKFIKLHPDGYSNQEELKYSCSSSVANLLEEGKTTIFSDDAETYYTLWRTIRDGMQASDGNDIFYLSYVGDHILGMMGDDFIEIDNHDISVDGDAGDVYSPKGGADVIMIGCGDVYAAGNGNSDHYFVNLNQKCVKEGYTKNIMINDISYGSDANKLHLCNLSFKDVTEDKLASLANNGIRLGLSGHNGELELYLVDNPPSEQKPNIIINHFCNNFNTPTVNPPIATIIDKNGVEISLQGLNCSTIATYLATHNTSVRHSDNNGNILSQEVTHNTSHNPVSMFTDYLSDFHLLSSFGHFISSIGGYLGASHTEL